jgi:hypothetical protein
MTAALDILGRAGDAGVRISLDSKGAISLAAEREPPSDLLAEIKANKPVIIAALTPGRVHPVDIIGHLEFRFGGKIVATDTGLSWSDRRRGSQPPAWAIDLLKHRRDEVRAWLIDLVAAVQHGRTVSYTYMTPADWRAEYHERAGILEHDGGEPRHVAERKALTQTIEHWLILNGPAPHQPDHCIQCGHAASEPELTTRICRAGQVWLHPRCFATYDTRREGAAIEALKLMIPDAPWDQIKGWL